MFAKRESYAVLVTDGIRGKLFPVKTIVAYNEGYVLRYKNSAKKLDMVYIDRGYRPVEVDGVYWVGKNSGNNSGASITYDGVDVPRACPVVGPSSDRNTPGEDLSNLIRNDSFAEGYRALYESNMNLKTIIIIVVAVIGVIALFLFIRSRGG
jgi:hypothetical protein